MVDDGASSIWVWVVAEHFCPGLLSNDGYWPYRWVCTRSLSIWAEFCWSTRSRWHWPHPPCMRLSLQCTFPTLSQLWVLSHRKCIFKLLLRYFPTLCYRWLCFSIIVTGHNLALKNNCFIMGTSWLYQTTVIWTFLLLPFDNTIQWGKAINLTPH